MKKVWSLLRICMLALSLLACSPSGVSFKLKAQGCWTDLETASIICMFYLPQNSELGMTSHSSWPPSHWKSKKNASSVVVSIVSSYQQIMVHSFIPQTSDFHQKRPIKSEFQAGKSEKRQLWTSEFNMAANIMNTEWKRCIMSFICLFVCF